MPILIDDGTLDTVIRCECGREHRFTFAMDCSDWPNTSDEDIAAQRSDEAAYAEFVKGCIADVTDTCECHETEE